MERCLWTNPRRIRKSRIDIPEAAEKLLAIQWRPDWEASFSLKLDYLVGNLETHKSRMVEIAIVYNYPKRPNTLSVID